MIDILFFSEEKREKAMKWLHYVKEITQYRIKWQKYWFKILIYNYEPKLIWLIKPVPEVQYLGKN